MNSSPSLSYPRPKLEILRTTLPPRSRTVPSSIDQAQFSPSVTLISMNSSPSLSYPRPKLKILRTTLPPRSRTVPSSRPHRPFLQPNLLLLLSHHPALPRLALPSANFHAASRLDADDLPEGISRRRRPTAAAAAAKRPLEASGGDDGGSERVLRGIIVRVGDVLSMAFPLFAGSACALALWRPSSFLWVHKDWQILGLALSMLGMGMTLTLQDLSGALLMPKELATGFVLQYTVMPLSGFFISKLLKLPSHYAAGLLLVASCPGGTASNIVTYIARGNVALSVLMTAASTITAVIMTPFFVSKLAGQFVAVDPIGLFISTGQVVLAPVLLGALLNQYCNSLVELLSPFMPLIVLGSVTILCGSVVATNASSILASGLQVLLSVCCLHASGFFFGYVLSRMLGIDVSSSRTISIQVGMQNGVLGIVLASQHFGNPLTVVPSAVSSVCHLAYGSLLAGIWRCMPPKTEVKD